MQIRHLKSIIPASDGLNRIAAICWSPDGQKLAVAGADKVVQLFDETGERKDRFATKPADPAKTQKYSIVAMAFSPDSTKLAIAQSDNVVFIYKLGLEWGEKKSICNKFIQTADITCMTWPINQPNSIIFGMSDGKVRVGNLKTNKAATLFQTESYVVSAASSMDGNAIITGHVDGSINRFFFDDGAAGASQGRFTQHRSAPFALSWGEQCVVAAGSDRIVTFYDQEGRVLQEFDYSRDDQQQEFTVAEFNPSGQSVVIGSFDRIHVFNYNMAQNAWEEAPVKVIENFYTVTALCWKPDGSRLVAGNASGAAEYFDCCLRRSRYKGKFEFTYVSHSQVIVKRLSTGSRIILKSHYGYEITKINIFQDQFLVANTSDTLLLGDLSSCKLSEIPWIGSGNEKFFFENDQICMVFNAGELTLVEYGINDILGSCRTEHMNPHLISVQLHERRTELSPPGNKRIAYLVDLQTINILDLTSNVNVGAISHDCKIDWLELNVKGTKLLFRDKRQQLHLFDIATQTRSTLLHYCGYVQWVPESDVVVAQNRNNLCIWYSIDSPERVTMFPIKGTIETIERNDGKTEVVVDEGVNTVSYTLDEGLIEFGSAVDDKDYERAITLLETLEMTPETEAMWKTLSGIAIKDKRLVVAERCFAALGDVAKVKYLQQLNDMADAIREQGIFNELDHYAIRARLAILDKNYKLAESIYLEQGRMEEAMEMYQEMHKWNFSIKVAETGNHPELENLKRNYLSWLLESGQETQAAEMKEEEGDYIAAMNLYLKGGMAARASYLLTQHQLTSNADLSERIAASLFKSGLYEKAGALYEKIQSYDRALDAYKRGNCYRAAVELCRIAFPRDVVAMEKQWGDYLVSMKQYDAAVNHYIEAGQSQKAVEAAITARQWKKAVGIVDSLHPPEAARPYHLQLAKHFEDVGDYPLAEKYYVAAGKPQAAVDMFTKIGKWEKAHTLATTFMSGEDVAVLYSTQAKEMESKGKLKDAEKLYLTVGEPDLAINMYKNHRQYDHMIRLVTAYHKDLLIETHLFLAKTLETEGNFKQAEHHYVEGKDWKSAVNMYCANNMYEEAYRVGKADGGPTAAKQVAYLWAKSLGGESAAKLLTKFSLLDSAIDFAAESGAFDFAFELTRYITDKSKIADVHFKYAMFLEDEGRFKESEAEFILASRPKEAILMYMHNEDFEEALRVAEMYEPSSVGDILIGQGKAAFDRKEFAKCESLLLRAQRPELVIKFYKDAQLWNEAIKFAKEYLPVKLSEIHEEYDRFVNGKDSAGRDEILSTARMLEQQKEFSRAVDMYLKLSFQHSNDIVFLEKAWEKAVDITLKFVPDRAQEVVSTVCARLVEAKKFDQAAQMYYAVEMYKDAIDACILAGNWEKAKEILSVAPKYKEYVETAYVNHLRNQGKADALVNVDVDAGLEVFAQRGDWDKCLTMAGQQGMDVLAKYIGTYVVQLIKENRFGDAAESFTKYGIVLHLQYFDIYTRITREILHNGNAEEISSLREMLYKLVQTKPTNSTQPQVPAKFNEYLFIAHLMTMKNYCTKKRDLTYFAAKESISLLRYTNEIPADRAFYEAGSASKSANLLNMAFICWNRFLDLSEAIEEHDASMLENADFENTDVPFDIELPASPFLSESEREQVRDWVLTVSLDSSIRQEIDKRDCEECGTKIYDASLECHNCHAKSEPCVVTGYPVLRNKVKCTSCQKPANKEDWNKFVMVEKMCPWCGSSQTPNYSLK